LRRDSIGIVPKGSGGLPVHRLQKRQPFPPIPSSQLRKPDPPTFMQLSQKSSLSPPNQGSRETPFPPPHFSKNPVRPTLFAREPVSAIAPFPSGSMMLFNTSPDLQAREDFLFFFSPLARPFSTQSLLLIFALRS